MWRVQANTVCNLLDLTERRNRRRKKKTPGWRAGRRVN
jgi:hypothetical protein